VKERRLTGDLRGEEQRRHRELGSGQKKSEEGGGGSTLIAAGWEWLEEGLQYLA
jgi:hypothetical protein